MVLGHARSYERFLFLLSVTIIGQAMLLYDGDRHSPRCHTKFGLHCISLHITDSLLVHRAADQQSASKGTESVVALNTLFLLFLPIQDDQCPPL